MREILTRVPVYKFEELEKRGQLEVIARYDGGRYPIYIKTFEEMQAICDELHLEFLADGSSDFTEVKLNRYQKEV